MKHPHSPILACIAAVVVFLHCGCGSAANRIAMAQGTLSVVNKSEADIFPVVQTTYEEDFGGVSAGAFKVIGFAAVEVDKVVRVAWGEGKWDASKTTVSCPMKVSAEVARQTKYLEFCYKGKGEWVLNLYGAAEPEAKNLLASIAGVVEPKTSDPQGGRE